MGNRIITTMITKQPSHSTAMHDLEACCKAAATSWLNPPTLGNKPDRCLKYSGSKFNGQSAEVGGEQDEVQMSCRDAQAYHTVSSSHESSISFCSKALHELPHDMASESLQNETKGNFVIVRRN